MSRKYGRQPAFKRTPICSQNSRNLIIDQKPKKSNTLPTWGIYQKPPRQLGTAPVFAYKRETFTAAKPFSPLTISKVTVSPTFSSS